MIRPATWTRLCGYRIAGPAPIDAGTLTAGLWDQVLADDQVQHIRIRCTDSHQYDIGILLISDSHDRAHAVGARICAGALAADPDTVGWTLQTLF